MDKKLEVRIARLEKLVYRNVKNENASVLKSISAAIGKWFNERVYEFDKYDLIAIMEYEDEETYNDIKKYLIEDAGFDKDFVQSNWRTIEGYINGWASDQYNHSKYDKGYIEW